MGCCQVEVKSWRDCRWTRMVAKKLGKENDLCRDWRIENRQNQQAKDATLKPCIQVWFALQFHCMIFKQHQWTTRRQRESVKYDEATSRTSWTNSWLTFLPSSLRAHFQGDRSLFIKGRPGAIIRMKVSEICMWMKSRFISKVVRQDSLWERGLR